MPSLGLSASQMNLLAQYEAVRQQSALSAGVEGFDVTVNGHTYLEGGAITTEGAVGNSRLATQTLMHEGVHNRDVVEGRGWSIGLNVGNMNQNGVGLGASSAGYARMDTDERSHTAASVGGVLTLTRPDLQASRIAAIRASEREPLATRLTQVNAELEQLYWNEPPPCNGCAYPRGTQPRGNGTADKASQPPPAPSVTPEQQAAMQGGNSEWLAWWNAIQSLQAEANQLNQRIAAVDAKVYGDHTNLSNSPSSLHQPVLHTFDSAKATQELRDGVSVTAAFGKAAYKAAGTKADDFQKAAQTACGGPQVVPCPEAEKWSEGGRYRTALHMAVGGMSFGTAGATGNLAAGLMTDALNRTLPQLGITDPAAIELLRNVAYSMAVTTAGAMLGGAPAAVAAFNADANNRQLHLQEARWIRNNASILAARVSQVVGRTVSEQEALFWLTTAGEGVIDTAMLTAVPFVIGPNISEEAWLYNQAKQYLNSNSRGIFFTDERGRRVEMFSTADKHNPFVYADQRNSAEYREFMWAATGTNLRPDNPTAAEAALYNERRAIDFRERGKQLLWAGLMGGVSAGGVAAMNRYSQARTFTSPTPVPTGTPIATPRVHVGVELDPRLGEPASGWGYFPTLLGNARTENQYYSHLVGYQFELRLANEVALSNQLVVKYGDVIGRTGADIISVNPRTGDVVLWDSKYRSADVSLGHSPTFVNQAARIAAIAEARQRIAANASLSPSVKSQAITNLDLGNFMTNTVGAGQVRNSVQVRFCNGNPC
jgi:hypothetical protein